MSYFALLFFSLLTLAGPRSIASFEEPVPTSYALCVSSLASSPTGPSFPKLYFQQLPVAGSFALRCHQEDGAQFMRFAFLMNNRIYSLKLPIYSYKHRFANGETESTELPRNIVHFISGTKDLYLQLEFADVAHVLTAEKLPEAAELIMTSTTKIQSEYVKKYESYLKSIGQGDAVVLKESSPQELSVLESCFEKKKLEILRAYIQAKFQKQIPALGTISDDSQNFQNLSESEKLKYRKKWSDIAEEAQTDLERNHPACEGIISGAATREAFSKAFEKSRAPYEALQHYLFE